MPRPPEPEEVSRFIRGFSTIQTYAYGINKANGFWDTIDRVRAAFPGDRSVEATLMISRVGLIQTEPSEAVEALRKHLQKDWASMGKDSLVREFAGSIVRIMDVAEDLRLPLAQAILAELEDNSKRGHKHGGKAA